MCCYLPSDGQQDHTAIKTAYRATIGRITARFNEEYTVRLRTKTSLPERLQATELKILGIHDSNENAIGGTASAGTAGTTVFLTDWTAPSTGRFYIAVGSEGTDRTGTY